MLVFRPGITGRVEISNRQADTKLKDLPLFADSLIEVTRVTLCHASADCGYGSQVFETRKPSAKEASVNLEQVLCVLVATAGAVTLMQVVPSVETGFAGTALHCHD